MRMNRRGFNRTCAGALGGLAALAVPVTRKGLRSPQLIGHPAHPDPRENVRGYCAAFGVPSGLEGGGANHWIVPAEHTLTPLERSTLWHDLGAGAKVVYELPAAWYRGEADIGLLGERLGPPSPLALGGEDGQTPYLRFCLGAQAWYIRHDSAGLAFRPPDTAHIVARQSDHVLAAEMSCAAGRVLLLGTRLGAPIGRGDRAAEVFLRSWFAAA